jgi:hypothetical protein
LEQLSFAIFFGDDYSWLVVATPLKNISKLGVLFPIYGKIKHVIGYYREVAQWPTTLY